MSQTEHKLELENQFILRMPEKQAERLRQAIKSGEPLSKKLSVKFDQDIRHATVNYEKTSLPARLYDLPTIIESYKTLDRKNFYKTADISQILICKEPRDDSDSGDDAMDEADEKRANYDKLFGSIGRSGKREFLYPHGITPPLKNVRKRRFRKTLKKKYVDFSEIEREVKSLLKFDCEAIKSEYEVIEENKSDASQPKPFDAINAGSPLDGMVSGIHSTENSQNIDARDLFGDESCSSDESDDEDDDDDDDDKDDDEMEMDNDNDNDNDNDIENDNDDDMNTNDMIDDTNSRPLEISGLSEIAATPVASAADMTAELAAASDLISSQNHDLDEQRLELNRELANIQDRIQTQEAEMRSLDNQALQMRLQSVLDSLHEQEGEVRRKLDELS